mgnify:CR=1 FL=1
MEPEAQLIAAQAAEELARQQATGTVDEIQRGRMAQQILGGAAQQAQAREARDRQAEFARRKRLGDVVAAGEAQKRIQDYQRETQRLGGLFQAGLGAASTLAAQGASYLAEQDAARKAQDAALRAEFDKIMEENPAGAVGFLNANPDFDPGAETLQKLYEGSSEAQKTRQEVAENLRQQIATAPQDIQQGRDDRMLAALARADLAALAESKRLAAEQSFIEGNLQEAAMRNVPSADEGMAIRAPIRALTPQEQAVEDAMAARRDRAILANRVADARMQKIAEIGYDPALLLKEEAILRENAAPTPQPFAPEATPIRPIAITDEEDAAVSALLQERQLERLQNLPVEVGLQPFSEIDQPERTYRSNQARAMQSVNNQLLGFGVSQDVLDAMQPEAKRNLLQTFMRGQ